MLDIECNSSMAALRGSRAAQPPAVPDLTSANPQVLRSTRGAPHCATQGTQSYMTYDLCLAMQAPRPCRPRHAGSTCSTPLVLPDSDHRLCCRTPHLFFPAQTQQPRCVRSSTSRVASVATKLVPSSGRLSATSMASTPLAHTTATPTFSWSASMCTSMRPLVVRVMPNTFLDWNVSGNALPRTPLCAS